MGKLTTHVLDTAHGGPGAGIGIRLFRREGDARQMLGQFITNADGRCDQPLLADAALQVGDYELEFEVGDYFARLGVPLPQPRFLDVIGLRFGIHDASAHTHVPLLVSPYGYSTYRGS